MNMDVRIARDRSLHFLSESQVVVATLSPLAVTALHNLALVPPEKNPIVSHHIQLIIQQLPTVIHETTRLGLTAPTDDGALHLTAAGDRLIQWLAHEWADWAWYTHHVPRSVRCVWGWQIAYP